MFFDEQVAKPEVKADPFSLESLIAWLETMPASDSYCYLSSGSCMVAQYLAAHGVENFNIPWLDANTPTGWNDIAQGFEGDARPNYLRWSFGAALTRARKALADQC